MSSLASRWNDLDDDDWQDMPVLHLDPNSPTLSLSSNNQNLSSSSTSYKKSDYEDDDERSNPRRRYHYNSSSSTSAKVPFEHASQVSAGSMIAGGSSTIGNATGRLIDVDSGGQAWKEKNELDEMDYTRLELDDDPDEDEVSMRTQYLFNEDKGMTPLSQMQTTKTLLTEGQRIAYVGLCRLVAREMVQTLALAAKGAKELEPAKESCQVWANKIMGRLYRHMEVDGAEQRMIEQLAEHGVTAEDLTPSLMSTYTVDNPEYDPEAARIEEEERAEEERERLEEEAEEDRRRLEREAEAQADRAAVRLTSSSTSQDADGKKEGDVGPRNTRERQTSIPASDDGSVHSESSDATGKLSLDPEPEGIVAKAVATIERRTSLARMDQFVSPNSSPKRVSRSSSSRSLRSIGSPTKLSPHSPQFSPQRSSPSTPPLHGDPFGDSCASNGDIGSALDPPETPKMRPKQPTEAEGQTSLPSELELPSQTVAAGAPAIAVVPPDEIPDKEANAAEEKENGLETPTSPSIHQPDNFLQPLPSSLPGVTTKLSTSDKQITLDIRWTILCDLFLSLIADSVYDARSRVLLGLMADKLGLAWTDVVRFERRLTEALEIQESVKQKEHLEVLESRRNKDKNKRYVMMGLATLGGGLVIGLSAGLLAPVIGAGLGAALTTVGVSGTTGFLAGAGGAAIISSGATLTGATIGGKAMAKRTRHVKTFEFLPLHNNKRVNFLITIPGFMNGPLDDVRLPFSPLDPLMGDVFSVLWEPEMMGDTGNALKILSTEVLTQGAQQVLALTVMTALMSALQWPMMLTKLSYLIDNPWSNALDRARQAGAVLADILINRRLGVRPVTLAGFSLGARVIFYALVELAKANAFGVVQEVYLFGATVTASKKVWRQVRGVVAGRFVNAFAMNDWVLGYLFRATSGGLQTVAGLRPIDHIPDLENVDITDLLVGHMSYRTLMPTLLKHVGFKVTADHFDEPEEMEPDAPDREVLTAEEEQVRKERKTRKKVFGIFPRSKKSTPTGSAEMSRETSSNEYDDLPPRLSSASTTSVDRASSDGGDRSHRSSFDVKGKHRSQSTLSISTVDSAETATTTLSDDSAVPSAPSASTATPSAPKVVPNPAVNAVPSGFDLDKLRATVAELPKNTAVTSPPSSSGHRSREASNSSTFSSEADEVTSARLARAQTDLTNLDTTLDPRELLRRQWAVESVPSAPSSAATIEENGWGVPAIAPSLQPNEPVFTFADSTGAVSSWENPANSTTKDPITEPTFVWGNANASTTSFRNENPW